MEKKMKIHLISDPAEPLANHLLHALGEARFLTPPEFCAGIAAAGAETNYVYLPNPADSDGMVPNLAEAQHVLQSAQSVKIRRFLLISSALIYGTGPGRRPLVEEGYAVPGPDTQRVCDAWSSLEALAASRIAGPSLIILRPSLLPGSSLFPARCLRRRFVPTLPGHDPVLQILSVDDLAAAIVCVIERKATGVFNIAPEDAIPLHKAISTSRGIRVPFPRTAQRLLHRTETLEYLRYPWTISSEKIKRELGFVPRKSSAAAMAELRGGESKSTDDHSQFDLFGMDKDYIRFYGKTLFRFLSDFYWRVEHKGIEYIPPRGRGLLVGMHRGFMPFDGVMALHTLVKNTGRYPRFLTHPGLLKFPFLANFMTKLGGIVACQESAGRVLESDELVGIFPEGIHGAFTLYRDSYKLQAFGRDAFVKLALRHRAPIVPFVTIGSAEIFPILGKIKSRRWTRYADWPYIPITPTFPLLPAPLPSKWHTQFLPPVSVDKYPPEAAEDRVVVKAISRHVRTRMQQAVDDMLSRRRSIFFGSIFGERADESQSKPVPV
jgi:1-acyl-sn-glycerol-3-phosphate acyltransferase/nucleoside-diphosphate-sugar epimerase